MSSTPYIFDVTDADFDQLVIQNSFHKPVLVDFWAEWCTPCKALMPLLARIAESYQGELLLAKMNTDVEPMTAGQLGVRSLPTVVLFKDGQPVDGFSGALPEGEIRTLLEAHVQPAPAAADQDLLATAQELHAAARFSEAETTLQQLLAEDDANAPALILYARCLAERGELAGAEAVLDSVQGDEHRLALAGARAQLAFLRQAQTLEEPALLKSRLAQNPQDAEAAYQLAIHLLARQQHEAALDALLNLFASQRDYNDGLPQKTLLQLFELLGNEHPLVIQGRRRMYQLLY